MGTVEVGLDSVDAALLASRVDRFELVAGPRVGDWVRFADGVERRISFITPVEWLPDVDSVQTSRGGSFYLGASGCSFSGSLYLGVPRSSLTLTDEVRDGSCWFFHHDDARAHNGVDVVAPFRVYECSVEATR